MVSRSLLVTSCMLAACGNPPPADVSPKPVPTTSLGRTPTVSTALAAGTPPTNWDGESDLSTPDWILIDPEEEP